MNRLIFFTFDQTGTVWAEIERMSVTNCSGVRIHN